MSFPTNTGGDVSTYSITPALPNGMSFDTVTGTITGTPSGLVSLTTYTVTAVNSAGSDTFSFNMEIIPPRGLWYNAKRGNARDINKDSMNNYYIFINSDPDTPSVDINGDGSVVIPAVGSLSTDRTSSIIKFNNAGLSLWSKTLQLRVFSSTDTNRIEVDSSDNIYVCTTYNPDPNPYDINGDGSLIIPPNNNVRNPIIIKFNSSGVAQWFKIYNRPVVSNTFSAHAFKIIDDFIYVVFRSPQTIDLNGDGSLIMPISSSIVKYNTSGVALSFKTITTNGDIFSQDLSVDSFGNIFISGSRGTANTNIVYLNDSQTVFIPASDSAQLAFVVKYNASYEAQWAKIINGPGIESITRCIVDLEDNVYVTGAYNSSSVIDLGNNVTLPITTGNDGFLIKYDNLSGNPLWSKSYIDTGVNGITTSVHIDSSNNVYITGGYNAGNIVPLTPTISLPITSGFAVYIVKYTSNGNYIWHITLDSISTESGRGIAIDNFGNIASLINLSTTNPLDINRDGTLVIPSTSNTVHYGIVVFGLSQVVNEL
jgi:hypothetical protein